MEVVSVISHLRWKKMVTEIFHQASRSTPLRYHQRYPINRWIDTSPSTTIAPKRAILRKTTWLREVPFYFSPFLWSKGSGFNQTNWLLPDPFPMTTVQKCLRQSWIRTLNPKNRSALDCGLPNWLCNSVIVQCQQIDIKMTKRQASATPSLSP